MKRKKTLNIKIKMSNIVIFSLISLSIHISAEESETVQPTDFMMHHRPNIVAEVPTLDVGKYLQQFYLLLYVCYRYILPIECRLYKVSNYIINANFSTSICSAGIHEL